MGRQARPGQARNWAQAMMVITWQLPRAAPASAPEPAAPNHTLHIFPRQAHPHPHLHRSSQLPHRLHAAGRVGSDARLLVLLVTTTDAVAVAAVCALCGVVGRQAA